MLCSALTTLFLTEENWFKAGKYFTRKCTPKTLKIEVKRLRLSNKGTWYNKLTSEHQLLPWISLKLPERFNRSTAWVCNFFIHKTVIMVNRHRTETLESHQYYSLLSLNSISHSSPVSNCQWYWIERSWLIANPTF